MIDMCMLYGFVNQGGAWFSVIDTSTGELLKFNDKDMKFQGRPKLYKFLKETPEAYELLNKMLTEASSQ